VFDYAGLKYNDRVFNQTEQNVMSKYMNAKKYSLDSFEIQTILKNKKAVQALELFGYL